MPELTLISVFFLGLLGGFHCAGMCGGIVVLLNRQAYGSGEAAPDVAGADPKGAVDRCPPKLGAQSAAQPPAVEQPVEQVAKQVSKQVVKQPAEQAVEQVVRFAPRPQSAALGRQLAYSGGRVLSYTAAGALMGAVGSSTLLLGHMLPIEQAGFVLVNLLMLGFALYLWGYARSLSWLEPLGTRLWVVIAPLAGRRLAPGSLGGALAAGALWGWLPCGMVYGMLIAALASQSAQDGALLLAAFGLGTVPNLVALGLGADRLMKAARRLWVRRLAAFALAAYAVAGLLRLDPQKHLMTVVDACLNWAMP